MKKNIKNYAFIDSQNLNLSIRDLGWKLDFSKFRVFLKDKYHAEKAFIFIGYVPGNESLYTAFQDMGYIVIFKPTLEKNGVVKGNCDAELVLHCMIEYNNFEKAIIISGDGDFHCLIEHLEKKEKLLKVGIPNRNKYSSLLRKFRKYFFFVSDLQKRLKYKKSGEWIGTKPFIICSTIVMVLLYKKEQKKSKKNIPFLSFWSRLGGRRISWQ